MWFPLLTAWRDLRAIVASPDTWTYAGIALSALGAAYVSWKAVGRTHRSKRWERTQLLIGTGLSFLGAVIAAEASMYSSRQEAALITGGSGYCYIEVLGFPCNQPIVPILTNDNDYPLYDVQGRIVDLDEPFNPKIVQGRTVGSGTTYTFGNLTPHSSAEMGTTFPTKSNERRFNIFFVARNGFFNEALRLVPDGNCVSGSWIKALRVSRGDDVLMEEVDPKFPRGPDGKVRW